MRISMKIFSPILVLALSLGTAMTASAGHHEKPEGMHNTVIDVATDAGNFTTLLAAINAAGLTETLAGDGPFTVFAPTDEAFAALPAGALENLLANPDQLAEILTLHVVAGNVVAAEVVEVDMVTTLQGATLPVDTSDGVRIGGATVVATDIEASNGVIHVIDTVILPASS